MHPQSWRTISSNKEACNRWSGPHRAPISASWSQCGITWRERSRWDEARFPEMPGKIYLPSTLKKVFAHKNLVLFSRLTMVFSFSSYIQHSVRRKVYLKDFWVNATDTTVCASQPFTVIHPFPPLWPTQHTNHPSFICLSIFTSYLNPLTSFSLLQSPTPLPQPPSLPPPALPQLLHYGEHGRLLNIHHSGQITQPSMPANDHYYSRQCQRQNLNLVQLAEGGEVKKAREGDREVGCRPVCLH